jgi:hypothetical protein
MSTVEQGSHRVHVFSCCILGLYCICIFFHVCFLCDGLVVSRVHAFVGLSVKVTTEGVEPSSLSKCMEQGCLLATL